MTARARADTDDARALAACHREYEALAFDNVEAGVHAEVVEMLLALAAELDAVRAVVAAAVTLRSALAVASGCGCPTCVACRVIDAALPPTGAGEAVHRNHWTEAEAVAAGDVELPRCIHGQPRNVFCGRCES